MSTGYSQTLISCQSRSVNINTAKIRDLSAFLLNSLGLPGHEVSIRFVGSRAIRELNRSYRGKDRTTDVLSFAQKSWKKPLALPSKKSGRVTARKHVPETLGDIVISVKDAARNARSIGQDLDREVTFLIVHGLLHLCGHDHENTSDMKRMFAIQDQLMSKLCRSSRQTLWKRCVELPKKASLN